jgi:hypothetical protein
MISSASIAAKIMGAIDGRKCLFVFTSTVGFFVDMKVKGGGIVVDEAVMVERLPRKCCSSASKLSSDVSPEPALESDPSQLVDSCSFTGDGTRRLDLARPLEVMKNRNSRLKELRRVDGSLIGC